MNKKLISITETAILIALAVVLDLVAKVIPFLKMQNGGSISLVMIPLIIIGLRRGVKYGLAGGIIYGFLNFIIDGYAFHWGSIFFDYLFAFGVFGLSGLFMKKRDNIKYVILIFVGLGICRYLFHSFGGVLFFAEYAKEAGYQGLKGAFIYSFIAYNLPYNLISILISTIIIVLGKRIITLNLEPEFQ